MASRNERGIASLAEQELAAQQLVTEIFRLKSSSTAEHERKYDLPQHLKEFKSQYESILDRQFILPALQMVSPRTKKLISRIPNPSEEELKQVDEILRQNKGANPKAAYDKIGSAIDRSRAAAHRNGDLEMWERSVEDLQQGQKDKTKFSRMDENIDLDQSSHEFYASGIRRRHRHEEQRAKMKEYDKPAEADISRSKAVNADKTLDGSSRVSLPKISGYPFDTQFVALLKNETSPDGNFGSIAAAAVDSSISSRVSPMHSNFSRTAPTAKSSLQTFVQVYSNSNSVLSTSNKRSSGKRDGVTEDGLLETGKLAAPAKGMVGKFSSAPNLLVAFVEPSGDSENTKSTVPVDDGRRSIALSPHSTEKQASITMELPIKPKVASFLPHVSKSGRRESLTKTAPTLLIDERLQKKSVANGYQPIAAEVITQASAIVKHFHSGKRDLDEAMKQKRDVDKKFSRYVDKIKTNLYEDMGINVDEAFTRRRIYGKALRLIIYYVYGFKTRSAFVRYRSQTKLATTALRHRSMTHINRIVRGFLARRFVADIKRQIALRLEAERQAELMRIARLNRWACQVTCGVRFYILMSRRRRRRAVISIQRIARGKLARNFVARLLVFNAMRRHKAISIQCAYRQHLARRQLNLYRKIEFVRQWMENIRREEEEKLHLLRINGASSCIAKAYRRHVVLSKLHRLIYWHHMEVAVVIQRIVRGFVARRIVARLRKEKIRRNKKRREASLLLQRVWRGYKTRQGYMTVIRMKQKEKKEHRQKKLALMQELAMVQKRRSLKQMLKEWNPFQYVTDREKATVIQRVFRGHHGRKRAFVLKCQQTMHKIEKKKLQRIAASITIQRVWRGSHLRHKRKLAKRGYFALRIQCMFRQFVARKKANWRRAKSRSLAIVQKIVVGFIRRRNARNIRKQEMKYSVKVLVIQKYARKYIAQKWIRDLRKSVRSLFEQRMFAEGKMFQVLCAVQLRIILDSLTHDIGMVFPRLSSEECPCNGPVQCLFILGVGSKARTDPDALMTNKIDAKSFSKIASKLENFISNSSTFSSGHARPEKRWKKQDTSVPALFQAVDSDIFQLPKGVNSFTQNDLDLRFAQARSNSADSSALTFSDFIGCLQTLAEVYFQSKTSNSVGARPPVRKRNNGGGNMTTGSELSLTTRPGSPCTVDSSRGASTAPSTPGRPPRSKFDDPRHLTASLQSLCGASPDLLLILAIQMLFAHRTNPLIEPMMRWLETESRLRLSRFVLRIQCLIRSRLAHAKKTSILQIRNAELKQMLRDKKVVRIQSLVRRFVDRMRVVHLAQKVLIKYVSSDGNSYWYNPSTRLSSWTKPKILGAAESASIALPPAGLEIVIRCSNSCGSIAKITCVECEDSYCVNCFESIHCKGNRRLHAKRTIPVCCYCNYQVASKHCLTCILQVPKAGTPHEFLKPTERGTYCDVCFIHAHDKIEQELSLNMEKKKCEHQLLSTTREAYIVRQSLHQKISTTHKFEHLVQPCEECLWRCASWRCADCDQIYCHKCLVGLHSVGGPFARHVAERLPYYTPNLHSNYQKDAIEQRLQRKLNSERRINKIRREEIRLAATIRIQAWWRGRYYARAGKQFMIRQRKKQRGHYRMRKREDKKRTGFVYKLKDIFGRNPPLPSDTKEETVLKQLPLIHRQRAREYIWPNLADWGYYRISSSNPRKGIPKRGFDVGTVDELLEQAQLGGYRLPGGVYLHNERAKHKTVADLSDVLIPGQMVRIETHLFYVREIGSKTITFDRKWLEASKPVAAVMYRVPASSQEKNGWYYANLFRLRVFARKNLVTQGFLRLYLFGMQKVIFYSLSLSRTAKNAGSLEDAAEWKAYALRCSTKAKRLSKYVMGASEGLALGLDVNAMEQKVKELAVKKEKARKSQPEIVKIADKKHKELEDRQLIGDQPPSAVLVEMPSDDSPTPKTPEARRRKGDGDEVSSVGGSTVTGITAGGTKTKTGGSSVLTETEKEEEELAKPMHLRYGRIPGVRWSATPQEIIERKAFEKTLTTDELIAMADEWEELLNPSTNTYYFVNKITCELIEGVPRPVAVKRQTAEDLKRSKMLLDDAQKRLRELETMQKGKIRLKK